MQNKEIEASLKYLQAASWNDTPTAFLRYCQLLAATPEVDLEEEVGKAAGLESVMGQPDLTEACHIAETNDRERFRRFVNTVEKLRTTRHAFSRETVHFRSSLELSRQLISIAKQEANRDILPSLVRMAYDTSYLSELLREGAKEAGGIAHNLAIALEDLQDVPGWGKKQLAREEQSLAKIHKARLHPDIPDDRRSKTTSLLTPFFALLAEATQDGKRHALIELCQLAVEQGKEGVLTTLEIGSQLHEAVDYPALMADEALHPLLLSIVDLERPGELIHGSIAEKWELFEEECSKLRNRI